MGLQQIKGESQISGTVPDAAAVKGLTVSSTPAVAGQVLTATSPTASEWAAPTGGPATAIETTGASVDVSAAAPPTVGQVLKATSPTTATWQTSSGGVAPGAMYLVGDFGGTTTADGSEYGRSNDSIGTDGTNIWFVQHSGNFGTNTNLVIDGALQTNNSPSVDIEGNTVSVPWSSDSDTTMEAFRVAIAAEPAVGNAIILGADTFRTIFIESANPDTPPLVENFTISGGVGNPTPSIVQDYGPNTGVAVLEPVGFTPIYHYPVPYSAYGRSIIMPTNAAGYGGIQQRLVSSGNYMYGVLTNDVLVKIDKTTGGLTSGTVVASRDLTTSGLSAWQSIAADATHLYIPLRDNTILKVAQSDLTTDGGFTCSVPSLVGTIAFGGTFVWAGGTSDPAADLYKINASSGALIDSITFPVTDSASGNGPRSQFLSYDIVNNKLWAGAISSETIYRIDPSTGFELGQDMEFFQHSSMPSVIDDMTNDGIDLFVLKRIMLNIPEVAILNWGSYIDRFDLITGGFKGRISLDDLPEAPKANVQAALSVNGMVYRATTAGEPGTEINVVYTPGANSVKSEKTIQDVIYRAKTSGADGDDITIEFVDDGTYLSETVTLPTAKAITVHMESGASTATSIVAAITGYAPALALVDMVVLNGATIQVTQAATNLENGVDADPVEVTRVGQAFSIRIADNESTATEVVDAMDAFMLTPGFPKLFTTTADGAVLQRVSWLTDPTQLNSVTGAIFGQRLICIGDNLFVPRGQHIMKIAKAI